MLVSVKNKSKNPSQIKASSKFIDILPGQTQRVSMSEAEFKNLDLYSSLDVIRYSQENNRKIEELELRVKELEDQVKSLENSGISLDIEKRIKMLEDRPTGGLNSVIFNKKAKPTKDVDKKAIFKKIVEDNIQLRKDI